MVIKFYSIWKYELNELQKFWIWLENFNIFSSPILLRMYFFSLPTVGLRIRDKKPQIRPSKENRSRIQPPIKTGFRTDNSLAWLIMASIFFCLNTLINNYRKKCQTSEKFRPWALSINPEPSFINFRIQS